jgi:hypothetical protein
MEGAGANCTRPMRAVSIKPVKLFKFTCLEPSRVFEAPFRVVQVVVCKKIKVLFTKLTLERRQ